MSLIIEAIPVPILIFSSPDLNLLGFNPRAGDLLLLEKGVRHHWRDFFADGDDSFREDFARSLSSLKVGDTIENNVLRLRKTNGRRVSVIMSFSVLHLQNRPVLLSALLETRHHEFLKVFDVFGARVGKIQRSLTALRKRVDRLTVDPETTAHLEIALGEFEALKEVLSRK